MSWLLAIIAVLFFGVFNFSADRSDQQPNTVESMYERSESKLCGKKRAPTFNGCHYVCECTSGTSCGYQYACWK
jgi:hypothetical protein